MEIAENRESVTVVPHKTNKGLGAAVGASGKGNRVVVKGRHSLIATVKKYA